MLASLPWAKPSVIIEALVAPDWASDAACKDLKPEQADAYFFPNSATARTGAVPSAPRAPSKGECLDLALENREEFGIWGGAARRRKPVKRCHCGDRSVAHGLCQLHHGREKRRQQALA